MSRPSQPLNAVGRRRRVLAGGVVAVTAAAIAIASTGSSAVGEPAPEPGTASALGAAAREAGGFDFGTIQPSAEFKEASFVAAGVGLRNQARGGITINGTTGKPLMTYVYWAIVTRGPGPTSSAVSITRTSPAPTATTGVKGTAVGTGPAPCWDGDTTTVYRGTVSGTVASGNGTYEVAVGVPGASTAGEHPWTVNVAPFVEGASLVMVYPFENASVSIFDRSVGGSPALSGQMFYSGSSHVLQRNIPSQDRIALFAEIGADGQTGSGYDRNIAGEITSINGTEVAGGNPGTAGGGLGKGSDWDGDDGNPLPQLWDTHVHDVGGLLDATTDKVEVSVSSDCLTHVANVIAG